MKRIILVYILSHLTIPLVAKEVKALPPATQEVKQAKIAAIIAIQKQQSQQKHDYYDYQQFFEQVPNSQPKDAKVPRYTEF